MCSHDAINSYGSRRPLLLSGSPGEATDQSTCGVRRTRRTGRRLDERKRLRWLAIAGSPVRARQNPESPLVVGRETRGIHPAHRKKTFDERRCCKRRLAPLWITLQTFAVTANSSGADLEYARWMAARSRCQHGPSLGAVSDARVPQSELAPRQSGTSTSPLWLGSQHIGSTSAD